MFIHVSKYIVMKKFTLLVSLLLFACFSFAQTRNIKTVKNPTYNPTNQQRKAVVIGMSDYGAGKSLENTLNDADDMADVLTRLGFVVTLLKNNDLRNLKENLNNWYATIEGNDMAIFYFAGHGVEVNGVNYLIPVDAILNSQTDVAYDALNVNQVLGNMDEKRIRFKLLILDACRDNPFARSWNRSGSEKGLAQMSAPKGTLIAFAAAPGATALDGGTLNLRNGVFTHFLKQEITSEGASIDRILNTVAGKVSTLTNDRQLPYKTGIITEDFYFIPPSYANPLQPAPLVVNVAELVNQANAYYNNKQYGSAFPLFKQAAEHGNGYAQFCLGICYEDGNGVTQDFVQATYWYKKAADQGIASAQTALNRLQNKPPPVRFANYTETVNGLNIEMIAVQGGTFTMGCTGEQGGECDNDERPAHQVTVSDFYIGKFEVTQAQWRAIMGTTVRQQRDKANTSWPMRGEGDNYPIYYVSWQEAQEFISRLNTTTGKQYRLPTEAEWEYAARGGSKSQGYKYSGSNNLANVAWYKDNSSESTHAVGTKMPNELGIYDMSGNVWEWCSDWYDTYSASSQRDPIGSSSGYNRVIRGGSWRYDAYGARVSFRSNDTPGFRIDYLGFRVVCSSQ